MFNISHVYLGIAIIGEVVGTTSLKYSEEFTKVVPTFLVISSYVIAFYALMLSLRTLPVSVAYAIWCGLGIILVTLISWFVHGQKLDTPAIIGICFIALGTMVINLFSKSTAH